MTASLNPHQDEGQPAASAGSDARSSPSASAGPAPEAAAGAVPGSRPGADTSDDTPTDVETCIPNVAVPRPQPLSMKGLLALILLASSLVAVSVASIRHLSSSFAGASSDGNKTVRDRPAAATAEPRKLDLSAVHPAPGAGTAGTRAAGPSTGPETGPDRASAHRIPGIVPTAEELANEGADDRANEKAVPIGVRRTGSPAPGGSGTRVMRPEDAPVLIVSTRPGIAPAIEASPRATDAASPHPTTVAGEPEAAALDPMQATARNLQAYQRQLQGLLDNLTRTSELARGSSAPATAIYGRASPASPFGGQAVSGQPLSGNLLGGQLPRSTTPTAKASMLGNRSLTLPKGTSFSCALKSRIVTASSGLVGCMVQRHVYGDDGRVLLIERGSHLDGEYRVTTVRPGTVRIPVLWTRVRTPHGVVVDLDSPATGQLGESGIDGHVDSRWGERLGAALLLSLIDDSVKLIIESQARRNDEGASTVILPSTTAGTSKLAEKVLDSTVNIPPLVYQNQGGIVGIYVARDVDFSGVYALEASAP